MILHYTGDTDDFFLQEIKGIKYTEKEGFKIMVDGESVIPPQFDKGLIEIYGNDGRPLHKFFNK